MMVLTARALKLVGKMNEAGSAADLSKFTDSSKLAEYAVESVASLAKAGIILGDGRAIHPVESATRAEVAVMIHRIYTRQ